MESWPRRHRITVDEYHRMGELGILAPDARVELIEGEIFDMAPIGKDHLSVVDQLTKLLVLAVGDAAIVRIQGSVRLSQITEPEPDVVLLKPRADFYRSRFALGTDTLLVIEVAESSLRHERCRSTHGMACPRSGSSTYSATSCSSMAIETPRSAAFGRSIWMAISGLPRFSVVSTSTSPGISATCSRSDWL